MIYLSLKMAIDNGLEMVIFKSEPLLNKYSMKLGKEVNEKDKKWGKSI